MTANTYEHLNTGELVQQTSAGDKEAYGELVTRYQGHVYGLAYSLVNHWSDAQDIAQEAFIRAYANIDQLNDPDRFPAWLRRITFSVTMNWIKSFRPKLYELIDGKVDLKIPAGTQPGTTLRMKGKGVSVNGKRGDQLVTVDVRVPEKISEQQRKLIEEFDREGAVTK